MSKPSHDRLYRVVRTETSEFLVRAPSAKHAQDLVAGGIGESVKPTVLLHALPHFTFSTQPVVAWADTEEVQ